MELYYFIIIERSETNACTFAYIWREGDNAKTSPPVKEFHSMRGRPAAIRRVSKMAYKWIDQRGVFVHPPPSNRCWGGLS